MFQVIDDSGFLALVVQAAYRAFVAEEWTFEQIVAHFQTQMSRRTLLIEVTFEKTRIAGFREYSGPLRVSGSSLFVTCVDVTLPEKHEKDQLMALPDGTIHAASFRCSI